MESKLPDGNAESAAHSGNQDGVSEPSPVDSPASFLWLTNRDQWLVVVLSVVVVILLAVKWQNLGYIDRSQVIVQRGSEDIGYQIDLNSATWVELTQLRGVGPVTAKLIVSDREEAGPFSSIDDLQRVKGIGPKTVEKNRRWLRVGENESSTNTVSDR
ncbi:MAG: ComEA family DNA-binding protein [Planctomycetales bacterium]